MGWTLLDLIFFVSATILQIYYMYCVFTEKEE